MRAMRLTESVCCLAAAVMLCGAPVLAQDTMGGQDNQQSTAGASRSGSMSRGSAGSIGMDGMSDTASSAGSSTKLSSDDKKFMETAMEGDMAEIQLAQLALQKASSEQVKQFAQHMIDDHTKLDAQMKPMAQQFGVEAPTDLSSKHKSVEAKLQQLSGAQFDKEYIKDMVADHREDDRAFVYEESASTNPTLKQAVTQAEPTIAEHLKMAQELEKSLDSKGSM